MTARPVPAAEPESDAHALLNTMLDLAEQQVAAIVAAGGEAALRARLARLLPPPAPAVPPVSPAPVAASGRDAEHELRLTQVKTALDTAHARLGGAVTRRQIATATAIVETWLASATGKPTPATDRSTTP